jgi:hypothetical protein
MHEWHSWLRIGCCVAHVLQKEIEALLARAAEVDAMYALLAEVGQRIPTADQVRLCRVAIAVCILTAGVQARGCMGTVTCMQVEHDDLREAAASLTDTLAASNAALPAQYRPGEAEV